MDNKKFQELIKGNSDLEKELIDIRRHLHRYPELSDNEYKTMEYICSKLDEWGIEYNKGVAKTGVVAVINGKNTGTVVALRADMDALPIKEENNIECASVNDGIMHACGHDAHTAILLMTARIVNSIKHELNGCVKFFFQPAEETIGGAERMIAEGWLENPSVDYVLGLHVEPAYDTGVIGIKYGKMYAASDMVDITIEGKGSHGAHPDEGIDAIIVAANIMNTVQTITSRNVSPLNSAVCTFGKIEGGSVRNQIADKVKIEGIIRTLDQNTRLYARNRVIDICKGVGTSMGANVNVKVTESYGPLINDDEVTGIVEKNAIDIVGENNIIIEENPDLSCEDFSYFAMARPSCYFHLGCYSPKNGDRVDVHNSKFTIDEDCLMLGVNLQVLNIISLMNGRRQHE